MRVHLIKPSEVISVCTLVTHSKCSADSILIHVFFFFVPAINWKDIGNTLTICVMSLSNDRAIVAFYSRQLLKPLQERLDQTDEDVFIGILDAFEQKD
jgi:hypothetical protein